jgi:transcriptional regulator with XRE-family HTH domain
VPKLTLVPTRRARRRPDPLLRDALGAVLRAERLAQHRTLSDVAVGARVSLAHLSEVERGRKEPSSEVLAAICSALRLPLAELLRRSTSYVTDLTSTSTTRFASGPTGPVVSLSVAA